LKKTVSILFVCLLSAALAYSQQNRFFWHNDKIHFQTDTNSYQTKVYGTQNGLPSSEITSLAQDSKGFIWVGSSAGASRFDGTTFTNYLKSGSQFTGKVYSIQEDTMRNIIWIGGDGGLFYFKNNKLYSANFKESAIAVYCVHLLDDNSLWIGTGEGPAYLSPAILETLLSAKAASIKPLLITEWKPMSDGNPAYKIMSSESGNIYFAGEGKVFSYTNKKLSLIWSSNRQKDRNDLVTGMVQGKNDTVFFATIFSGVFGIKNNTIKQVYNNDGHVSGNLLSHNGQIYQLTSGGIFELLTSTREMKKISMVPEDLNVWISCLLVDNENNLWIGMHDNLLYQKKRIFFNYQSDESIAPELFSIFQDKKGQLFFGANRGKVYKKQGANFENIFGTKRAVQHAEIKSIYEDNRGWLWLGTGYEGIALQKNNNIFHYTQKDGLSTNTNYFFYQDDQNNIFTGGDGGFSKITYDTLSNSFRFKNFYYDTITHQIETFKNCISGPDHSLWLSGQSGIFRFKDDSLTKYFIDEEKNINFSAMKKDLSGEVWLATKGDGIWECYFDQNNLLRLKQKFNVKVGLLSDIYLDITTDNENNIWAGSYSGITYIKRNNENYFITNYTSADGFLSDNYQSLRILCDNKDTVWIATSSGLASVYAGKAYVNKKLVLNFLDISLTDISKNIASYQKNQMGAVPELPYNLNEIGFHFKAICLSDPQMIKYSYRLIGLTDTAWMPWTNKTVAFYQNLSPGNYSFQVRASLDDEHTTHQIAYHFIINKPFWQQWWFFIPCLLLGIFLIFILTKKWRGNIQKKNEERIKLHQSISEHLQYRLEIEQVTNYFATLMSTSGSVDDLLWNIVRHCISKLNFEDCVIYLVDSKGNMLVQKAALGPKSVYNKEIGDYENAILGPIEVPVGIGITGTVAFTGIAEIVPDVSKDERYIKDDDQRFSEITVPIIYNNEVLGVIDSENKQKNYYSETHLQILTAIASHCAERIVKMKADEEIRLHEEEILNVKNRLAEEKLTALRSQMNPHFIFNSLNSIQQYILNGEIDNANKYLSKFSKLIRLVLQYSEYNFISLDEEINMLELYLSVEKTRFGNSFEYKILIEDDLDTEEIKIPNLMIQPFVENAIWHGLMHKTSERKIDIIFHLKNDNSIVCVVTDNGIGRRKAEEIKNTRSLGPNHESKGMELVRDKIDVLKQQFESEVSIEVYDINDMNGDVCGTKVIIQLPVND
jgi:ligand-binding sensor domain-containing protein/putative methionine-R-sulfoxide reductase with GAF domain